MFRACGRGVGVAPTPRQEWHPGVAKEGVAEEGEGESGEEAGEDAARPIFILVFLILEDAIISY